MSTEAEIVLSYLVRGYHKEGHHPNCSTRTDEGCDCYARATAPARAALRRLDEQLEAVQRDAFTERETRCIARILEPSLYPMEGEDFTDILNEALGAVRRVMGSTSAKEH